MKKLHIGIIAGVSILVVILVIILSAVKYKKEEVKELPVPETSFFEEAQAELEAGHVDEARGLYRKAIEVSGDINRIKSIQEKVETINMDMLFSQKIDECSAVYEVRPKDTLIKIARQFGTTVGLIKRANSLKSDVIRPGQRLKVSTCKFSIAVDKSQNMLFLKRNGEVIKAYTVSTGKDNTTPVGTFKIDSNKLRNPTWHRAGAVIPPDSPDNILGTRWMGLEGVDDNGVDIKGYGIHGTTEPQYLGQQVTLGCVRMKNEDVEELFDIVPCGTEVTIVD